MPARATPDPSIVREFLAMSLLVGSVGMLWSPPVHAQARKRIELVYVAPPSCPSKADFTNEIMARTEQAEFVEESSEWNFGVQIRRVDERFSGRIDITERGQEATSRQFDDDRCADIVASLALVGALAVDPNAKLEPLERRTSEPPPAEPPPPAAPEPPATPSAPPPREGSRAPSERSPWSWSMGALVALTTAPAPEPLLAAGIGATFEDRRQATPSLALGLSVLAAETGVVSPAAEHAEFRWTVLRMTGCPVRLGQADGLSVRPCAFSDLGTLRGRGEGPDQVYTETRFWASAGLGLRASWEIGSRAFVHAAGGALLSLTQDDFVFRNPDQSVHEVPPLGATAEAGAGAYF
jgi:hypothetical protein